MSDSIDTPRPGLVTRAKNANQRPGKILTNGRRRRRTPAQMAADKKAAKKKAVVVAAKNVDIEAKKAAITRRVAQLEGAHLKESTVGKSTTAIEPPHSDGVGLGRQTLSAVRAAQILKRTKAHSELTPADVESTTSTTHGPQMYDIVAIAQMVVAGLASPRRKVTRDPISIEVQSLMECKQPRLPHLSEHRRTFIGEVPPAPPPRTPSPPAGFSIPDTDRDDYRVLQRNCFTEWESHGVFGAERD